jgi:hypothetical protein
MASSVMPPPFQPVGAPTPSAASLSLAAAQIPPIEALTPVSGLDFGDALQLGPALLVADLAGLALLCYIVRRRWMSPAA